jgi:hypothetical protein
MIAPSWPRSPVDGAASLQSLVPSLVSACLVSNGCVGLVAFFALSLPCALVYIVGLMANQMLGTLLSRPRPRRTLASRRMELMDDDIRSHTRVHTRTQWCCF